MDLDAYIDSLMKTETPPKYPFSMYYTEGIKYLNLGLYHTALEFLDAAVAKDKTSVKSLLKRSKCFVALREYEKAIEDADTVLQMSQDNVFALDLKGQAQYLMGDFEGGYLTYINGRRKKPINNELRLGKQLCREVLDYSMDPSETMILNKRDVATIVDPKRVDETFEGSIKSRISRRELFGRDKKFMEELMKDKNLASVHGFCQEAVNYIKDGERFWAMVKPVHTRKQIPRVIQREIRKPVTTEIDISICKAAIRRAENELSKGNIDYVISELGKLLKSVGSLPKERQKEKIKIECDAFHLMSLTYSKVGDLGLSRRYLLKELEIANKFHLQLQQTRANHLLGVNYQLQGDVSKALQCFNKVSTAMDSERIELIHEEASTEEVAQLKAAQEWLSQVVSGIRMSIRESIFAPIVETFGELFPTTVSQDSHDASN